MRNKLWLIGPMLAVAMAGQPAYAARGGGVTPPPPASPPARAWHAMASNGAAGPTDSRVYMFGGSGSDTRALGDFWYYRPDLGTWTFAPTGSTKPGTRQHPGLSCTQGQCVTAYGSNGISLVKETWTYAYTATIGSWTRADCRRYACPSARQMVTLAYDQARGYHLMFGGMANNVSLGDTSTFAAGRWTTRTPATSPSPRNRAGMLFVPTINKLVLFGGQVNARNALCDMWAWTGSTWQQITTSGEAPCVHSHTMTWNGTKLVVTRGYTDTSDTPNRAKWLFSFDATGTSGTWTRSIDACAESSHSGARGAAAAGHTIYFGGEENGPNGVIRYGDTVVCD